jgi:hypothetical protein
LYKHSFFNCLLLVLILTACSKPAGNSTAPAFAKPLSVAVQPGLIDEVSGIADSYLNEGYLWAEQDGGNPADLHLLKHDGGYYKRIRLKGVINRDWEDMVIASGPDPSLQYIYLADIGDNSSMYPVYDIYRMPEPVKTVDTISFIEKISFQYPDGSHDAEAIMIDNAANAIYIITKRDASSILYKLPFPQSTSSLNFAVKLFTLPFSGAVSAAVSPDQKEIIIKTYTHLYYWQLKAGESLENALKRSPEDLPYEVEPQGEAVSFKKDGSGFFTLSEKGFAGAVSLNFYKRN